MSKQNEQFEYSVTITIYSIFREGIDVKFYLRNLQGATKDEQLKQAKQIQQTIVSEIHTLTKYGIDKGFIRCDGKKVEQTVFHEFEPISEAGGYGIGWFMHKIKCSAIGAYQNGNKIIPTSYRRNRHPYFTLP